MENTLTPLERLTTEFVTYRHNGVVRIQVDQSTIDEMLVEQNNIKKSSSTEHNEKLKFFAQYYGQDCLTVGNANCDNISEHWCEDIILKTQYLLLTPLSAITDEDAEQWYYNCKHSFENTLMPREYLLSVGKFGAYKERLSVEIKQPSVNTIDYLRSKGYALPYMGLSVEQLIEYGWIKLKD